MSGRDDERPDEVIEHGPVTLHRYRKDDVTARVQLRHHHRGAAGRPHRLDGQADRVTR